MSQPILPIFQNLIRFFTTSPLSTPPTPHPTPFVALVFGREADGLRSSELFQCTHTCEIATSASHGSLNLAQVRFTRDSHEIHTRFARGDPHAAIHTRRSTRGDSHATIHTRRFTRAPYLPNVPTAYLSNSRGALLAVHAAHMCPTWAPHICPLSRRVVSELV